jgi:pantoate--beta-alanine ligase
VEVVRTVDAFVADTAAARLGGRDVGLVPTMGALHAGHRSLIDRAMATHDHVVVSVFVNPLQFDRDEDLARYPRDLDADVSLCATAGVATVFAPSAGEMYPRPPLTTVHVAGVSEPFEGQSRPGHFDGVATVVAKLFAAAGACTAYFGEKDFQQLAVIRRMVSDLSVPVRVVACPTVRDPDGLALSSRNALLSGPDRRAATVLWRSLGAGAHAVATGELRPSAVVDAMERVVRAERRARLDYAAAVDADDLSTPASLAEPARVRLLVAARIGDVRLIDNCDAPAMAGFGDGRHRAADQLVHGQEER